MNWVGGARKRIRGPNRSDRKIQKEFFERRRLNAATVKAKEHDSKHKKARNPKGPKQGPKVSQDLLAFQMSRKTGQNTGRRREKINFRVIDLGSKKAGMTMIGGKYIQNVDLPVSPQNSPSVLNLSGSPGRACSGDRDKAKMRHKTKQCCREQSRGISCRGFHFQDSAKDIETSVPRSNIPMDLFGEKMYVSESRAFTGRCQPLKESLHSNRSESTTYQYPTGAALRQVHLQPVHHGHYDADSEVSSLFSNFPEKRRLTVRRTSGWSSENDDRKLYSQQQVLMDRSCRPQNDFQIYKNDTEMEKNPKHQKLPSPLAPFHLNDHMNTQISMASECAESASPSSDLSYMFTKTPRHTFDTNQQHGSFLESVLGSEGTLSYTAQKHNYVVKNSLPRRTSFSNPCLLSNTCTGLSNPTDNYCALSTFSNDIPSYCGSAEAWTPGIQYSTLNYRSDLMGRVMLSKNSTAISQDSEHGDYLTTFISDNERKQWSKVEDLRRVETRCHTPVASAEKPSKDHVNGRLTIAV